MNSPLYVDVHVLQTVPPSNLNRDDAGSPKQAVYGGTRRARVSSQAWKRATRKGFADRVPAAELGTRTRALIPLLSRALQAEQFPAEDADRVANQTLDSLGLKVGKRETETQYLLFVGRTQINQVVAELVERRADLLGADEKSLKETITGLALTDRFSAGHPLDVALFGRMVADIPALNVDAATQVAHALSTHSVDTEFDYFTAVDDENERGDTGAGMIGTVEFNSSTLYRYATVAVHQLQENLVEPDAVLKALGMFLECFVQSIPSGHQNSFAHHTAPNLAALVTRTDQPVNLVSAFEAPVTGRDGGIVSESQQRLAAELTTASRLWGLEPQQVAATYTPQGDGEALHAAFGEPIPYPEAVTSTLRAVEQWIAQASDE